MLLLGQIKYQLVGMHDERIFHCCCELVDNCIIWQYGLWSFQTRGPKLERFLPKNQHTQRKLLNFENRVSGEVSKIEHHFSK